MDEFVTKGGMMVMGILLVVTLKVALENFIPQLVTSCLNTALAWFN